MERTPERADREQTVAEIERIIDVMGWDFRDGPIRGASSITDRTYQMTTPSKPGLAPLALTDFQSIVIRNIFWSAKCLRVKNEYDACQKDEACACVKCAYEIAARDLEQSRRGG